MGIYVNVPVPPDTIDCTPLLSQVLLKIVWVFRFYIIVNLIAAILLFFMQLYFHRTKKEWILHWIETCIIINLIIALWFFEIYLRGG